MADKREDRVPSVNASMAVDMDEPGLTKAMLGKVSKQQHLLLQELERTKRCLRTEKLERGKIANARSTKPGQMAWAPLHEKDDSITWLRASATLSSKNAPNRRALGSRRGAIGTRLKRSRSEAGMGPADSDAEDSRLARGQTGHPDTIRPTPPTRIDMLTIMSTTGEAALEVGLSAFPVGRSWTAEPRPGQEQKSVHMLPVFKLPEVSKNPAGGFVRRLPREETPQEREYRVREAEELERMKKAIGLTDRELEALEAELLPARCPGKRGPSATGKAPESSRRNGKGIAFDFISEETLLEAAGRGKHGTGPRTLCTGKRRRRGPDENAPRKRDGSRAAPGRHAEWDPADKRTIFSPTFDGDCVYLPTPRVLRRTPYSTLGAELAASAALSGRYRGLGNQAEAWKSSPNAEQGDLGGCVLGSKVTTEQLVAAAADVGMVNLLELRRELGRSVGNVRCLARAVKADVQEVTRMCPVQNPRAKRFLRRWACERLSTLADEIVLSRAAASLERWRYATSQMAMAERREAYRHYQGSRKLGLAIHKAYLRRLAKGWVRWISLMNALRAEERRALELEAAILIQRTFRGLAARRLRAWLARAARDRERHLAAVVICRHARGKVARMRFGRFKADVQKVRAAEVLKRVGRGMLGRKETRRLREQRGRNQVAVGLQRLYRGRHGRRLFLAITKQRRERTAATRIQTSVRGVWGRRRALRRRQRLCEQTAARQITSQARAWLAQRLLRRLREDRQRVRALHAIAALSIQRVYRGHRARILHGTRLEISKSSHRERDAAATRIQALLRAHLSKRTVNKLSNRRKEQRISDARLWTETWSEDAQAWFYYNAHIGEALWEPPRTGYTKHDGKLVLMSGEVVGDPLLGLTEEEREEAKKQLRCVECEDKRATRKCEQCEDGYCTRCFRKTHASGRRAKHKWTHVGPMECAECESEVAIKWCTACDDPFCGPCWIAIHSRGKRVRHSHCTISPGGRISAMAVGPDGSACGPFQPGESLLAEITGTSAECDDAAIEGYGTTSAFAAPAEMETGLSPQDWQEYSDDSGAPYWHNSVSGVSQYDNPFASLSTVTHSTVSYEASAANGWDGRGWDAAKEPGYGRDNCDSAAIIGSDPSYVDWSEHVDDEGHAYYYNAATGVSQYERP